VAWAEKAHQPDSTEADWEWKQKGITCADDLPT